MATQCLVVYHVVVTGSLPSWLLEAVGMLPAGGDVGTGVTPESEPPSALGGWGALGGGAGGFVPLQHQD